MAPRKTKLDQLREWTAKDGEKSLARQWREDAELTVAEAAVRVKVSTRSIERYEAGAVPRDPLLIDSFHAYLKSIRPREES